MSKTSLDISIRTGIWNAYKNKCFYCDKYIEFKDLQIDHIIPESLSELELKELILEYGLNGSFSINAYENLVPTHRVCNQRKTNNVFNKKAIHYFLGLSTKKVKSIREEINKLKRKSFFNQLNSKIVSALEKDYINVDELTKIINEKRNIDWSEKEIKLPIAINFEDGLYDTFSFNKNFDNLYSKQIIFGETYKYINLSNDSGVITRISNLREWINAINNGFYPCTNTDIKMSENVDFLANLIEALKRAKLSKASFLDEPWIDIDNIDYLSPKIIYDPEEKLIVNIQNGESIGDLYRRKQVRLIKTDVFDISIEFNGFRTSISEQFRADLNDDGIEDILVRSWYNATRGSLGFGGTLILTRKSTKSLIEPYML
ncbi:HNH endonuclease [Chryseobacterium lactis]|uniref:HNH endonuclease n=1 Tax=Chryseobacterium lactis TaxID=1241981 RepID=UPI0016290DAA|nr:HNH endonuclease signature motif containing protein [Chryseobacterium lactis]